jgi:HSP90 family molecular chaperone
MQVFIREVISNSSDALEKLRHHFITGKDVVDLDINLEIKIETNEEAGTFTIQDNGIGMTEGELLQNLGVIAKSGSKAFIEQLKHQPGSTRENIIGQFGVGFYSTFMVADKVDVFTKSHQPNSQGYFWTSDGLVLNEQF